MSEAKVSESVIRSLAETLTREQLESTSCIKKALEEQHPEFIWDDWWNILVEVRKEKYKDEHDSITPREIWGEMPFYAQKVAEIAIRYVMIAAKKGALCSAPSNELDAHLTTLWTMFYCMTSDIKNAAINIVRRAEKTGSMWGNKGTLMGFLEEMREVCWEHGEVFKLRTKDLA